MACNLEHEAKEALIDENFELALDLYTQAISLSPDQAVLFADRSQANIKLNNFPEAVADANKAIELDASMAKAYYRKGIACMKLEEYQTAKAALETGASLTQGDSKYLKLIKECDERIAEEMGNPQELASEPPSNTSPAENVQPVNEIPTEVLAVAPSKPKYRHEFYQKQDEVVVTIFAKGVPADCVSVDFGGQILSVIINVPGENSYHLQPRLFGKIIPDKCKFTILSTKVEIRLAKAEPIQWNSLEYSKETTVIRRADVSSGLGHNNPSYPSSKPKGVDWDKLEAQVKKEEKDEKLDGDAALNKFFREIYADADEDTRRAMSKSFVESNGTVLSTNWKEVGSKKVEGSPPDGMEMKKWEY